MQVTETDKGVLKLENVLDMLEEQIKKLTTNIERYTTFVISLWYEDT